MIDRDDVLLLARECGLLRVSRSTADYEPVPERTRTLEIVRAIDEIHTDKPFFGSRWIAWELEDRELRANRTCVQRLMRWMDITAIDWKPRTTRLGLGAGHKV